MADLQTLTKKLSSRDTRDWGVRDWFRLFSEASVLSDKAYYLKCRVYAKMLNDKPEFKFQFQEMMPSIPETAWYEVEQVGRGFMHPELLFDKTNRGCILKKLTITDQKTALTKELPALIDNEPKMIRYEDMDADTRALVFADNHIRSLSEQEKVAPRIKRARSVPKIKQNVTNNYRIERGGVYFKSNAWFSKKQLETLIGGIDDA